MCRLGAHQKLALLDGLAASRVIVEPRMGSFLVRSLSIFPMGKAASMILQQQGDLVSLGPRVGPRQFLSNC